MALPDVTKAQQAVNAALTASKSGDADRQRLSAALWQEALADTGDTDKPQALLKNPRALNAEWSKLQNEWGARLPRGMTAADLASGAQKPVTPTSTAAPAPTAQSVVPANGPKPPPPPITVNDSTTKQVNTAVAKANTAVTNAQAALTQAQASGDQTAITAARQNLALAQQQQKQVVDKANVIRWWLQSKSDYQAANTAQQDAATAKTDLAKAPPAQEDEPGC